MNIKFDLQLFANEIVNESQTRLTNPDQIVPYEDYNVWVKVLFNSSQLEDFSNFGRDKLKDYLKAGWIYDAYIDEENSLDPVKKKEFFKTMHFTSNMEQAFYNMIYAKDLSPFIRYTDPTFCDNMTRCFTSCASLETVDLSPWAGKLNKVKYCRDMFKNEFHPSVNNGLKKLDLSMLSFPNVENTDNMFGQLEGLTELKVPKMGKNHRFNNARLMFNDLKSIKTIDVTGIDFSRVGNFEKMFNNCENLEEIKGVIDMRAFGNTPFGWTDNINTWAEDPAPPNVDAMFFNCPKLKKVTILTGVFLNDSIFRNTGKLNSTCELEIRRSYESSGINAKIEVKSS
nr:MAG TPA: protein of unknown function DUF285 [Caudoviricetes sp.]